MTLEPVGPPSAQGAKRLPEVGPDEPVSRVVGVFLGALLETVERHLPGLIADLDAEFLHRVRVTVRRTRSLLRELAAEPELAGAAQLERELSWLGGRTGPCRDMDVLLEALGGYTDRLPYSVRDGVEPVTARARRLRCESHQELLSDLGSGRCRELLRDWRRTATELTASAAGRPIGQVADERIRAVAGKTLDKAGELDDNSPDFRIHRLRIRCKRLRYLLESFRGLYPADTIDPVISTLRRLQDRLGAFQDLSVHAERLQEAALTAEPPLPPAALVATGALLTRLERDKNRQRKRVLKALARFLAEEPDRVARLVEEGLGE